MSETVHLVPQGSVGLLYEDGAYVRQLDPGRYELKQGRKDRTQRRVQLVDLRERSLTIKGQEILTADKVAIRTSLLVYFWVIDPEAAVHNVASYETRIYEDVQLSARRYLASRDLEAIMVDRNDISDAVKQDVQTAAEGYGVQIVRADVKDLVFPGNLRTIMNQVLETERRAEAQLIQAHKNAETQRIQMKAANQARVLEMESQNQARLLELQAETEQVRLRLEAELQEAQALVENPVLLQLRQLDTLKEMAGHGATLVLNLGDNDLADALRVAQR